MSKTLLRQWLMLKQVPRQPRRISSLELQACLKKEGYEVTLRTIQRDLQQLAKVFPGLVNDGNRDIIGWFWNHNSEVLDIPGIDPPMALTFKLAQSFLDQLIPPSVMELLQPYQNAANQVLAQLDDRGFGQWNHKVAIVPRTQPLIPARITPEVIRSIYDALLHQRRFRGVYRSRREEQEFVFNPYGLVYRDSVIYLVATVWDYKDPRHYALHRFSDCEVLEESFELPDDFDLQGFISSGSFEYIMGAPFRLTLWFTPSAGHHLQETPLSEDQKITHKRNGWLEIQATVKNSLQLRWWLLGFGGQVQVIRPQWLQEELETLREVPEISCTR